MKTLLVSVCIFLCHDSKAIVERQADLVHLNESGVLMRELVRIIVFNELGSLHVAEECLQKNEKCISTEAGLKIGKKRS